MDNHYHFVTDWYLPGHVEEVTEIFANTVSLARWWPSVYLAVEELAAGDENGVGRVIALETKGWLPYRLHWHVRASDVVPNEQITLAAEGDFVGYGVWTFAQQGDQVHVRYDWDVAAEKPLLRALTPLIRPVFSANHRWAMRMGRRSLELEMARRRARTAAERALIPPPPGPTQDWLLPAAIVVALLTWNLVRRTRRGAD